MLQYNDHKTIQMSDYEYPLPDTQIAKYPLEERSQSRLLYHRKTGELADHHFYDIPDLLPPNSLLVVNDTKVIRARLFFKRPTGSRIEIFCLEPLSPPLYEQALSAHHHVSWHCMIGNARRWKEEYLELTLPSGVVLRAYKEFEKGDNVVTFRWTGERTFGDILEEAGELPIPPYLNRSTEERDLVTYQTVYAREEGSVAAPTAGLHFTPEVFDRLHEKGIETTKLVLHVGAGTFKPVKTETIGDHQMHAEVIHLPKQTLSHLIQQLKAQKTIVAVGTTSTRTLESLYYMGVNLLKGKSNPYTVEQWQPYEEETSSESITTLQALEALEASTTDDIYGVTRIIIVPGFKFRLVDILVTNFHQPHSTLLLLISAFLNGAWKTLYHHALSKGYRFLSYGDSSLLEKPTPEK